MKVLFSKESVLLNFEDEIFRFYNIKVIRKGPNQFEIISNYGKLGNKGTINVKKESNYKKAMAEAYNRYYEKKAIGYISKKKASDFFSKSAKMHSEYRKKEHPEKVFGKTNDVQYKCDLCQKALSPEIYHKINQWGRTGGNWDADEKFVGYKKVLCIDCQFKHNIFKKPQ